jgi:anti-anti-sigma regulatory factor
MDLGTFAIHTSEEPPQIRLAGEFDIVSEPALQEALDRLCRWPERSLVVDVSEATFMGVGSLRRIVHAGRGFVATEFRSPVPIVEKVLRLLGFVDETVGIEGGATRAVASNLEDQAASVGPCDELPRIALEGRWHGSRASRHCSGAPEAHNTKWSGRAVSA